MNSPPKNLIIIGAGAFGREVLGWAKEIQGCDGEWTVKGFLDDKRDALSGFGLEEEVLSSVDDYGVEPGDLFVCAIGVPKQKRRVCEKILSRGGEFVNLVHPSVIVGREVKLGRGIILCPRATLSCDIVVGDFVTVNLHSCVSHDVRIGNWTQLSDLCDLCGGVALGEEVFLGSHASILPGCRVGDRAVVGAGAVVSRDVEEAQTVIGVPARPLDATSKQSG